MLFLVTSSLVLCACVNGLAVGENKADPSPLVYETFAVAGRYLFDPSPNNWTDASKVCNAYNGHLAYPKTQDEADALWTIMTRYNVKQVHVGFHDQFLEGVYFTAKGRLLNETSFNKWSSGAPIGGSSRNCGGLRGDGLVDVACSDSYPSICEENQQTNSGGYLDYDYIEGHGYYKLHTQGETWTQSLKTCYKEGAHLLILNSEEEFDAMKNKYNKSTLFVGVHRYFENTFFVTILDDSLESTGFPKWEVGEPAFSSATHPIVELYNRGLIASFDDRPKPFVCEYEGRFSLSTS